MDSPICIKRSASGARMEIYPQFGRIVAPDGGILMEFAAAHVRDPVDRERWPVELPPGLPEGAIAIDRYGDYKPGRHTPHGVANSELIAAIRAMRPVSVAHLQNDDSGCGAAVVATLRGISYTQAVEELYGREAKRSLAVKAKGGARGWRESGEVEERTGRSPEPQRRAVRMLGTQRLAAATGTTCKRSGAETLAEAIKAGAVAALIRRDGARWGHYVAIAPGGVVIDPELVLKWRLEDYPRKAWRVVAWFVAGES